MLSAEGSKNGRNRPKLFIAHSFESEDTALVRRIKEIARSVRYKVYTGEIRDGKAIGKKIRSRISESDIFLGLFTRRYFVEEKEGWLTSAWVVQEKGFSLGNRPSRPIINLVESRVLIPEAIGGLEGDNDYISFDRYQLYSVESEIRRLLNELRPS